MTSEELIVESIQARRRVVRDARFLRQGLGLTLLEVATAIGSSAPSVSRWERTGRVGGYEAMAYMRFLDRVAEKVGS